MRCYLVFGLWNFLHSHNKKLFEYFVRVLTFFVCNTQTHLMCFFAVYYTVFEVIANEKKAHKPKKKKS